MSDIIYLKDMIAARKQSKKSIGTPLGRDIQAISASAEACLTANETALWTGNEGEQLNTLTIIEQIVELCAALELYQQEDTRGAARQIIIETMGSLGQIVETIDQPEPLSQPAPLGDANPSVAPQLEFEDDRVPWPTAYLEALNKIWQRQQQQRHQDRVEQQRLDSGEKIQRQLLTLSEQRETLQRLRESIKPALIGMAR